MKQRKSDGEITSFFLRADYPLPVAFTGQHSDRGNGPDYAEGILSGSRKVQNTPQSAEAAIHRRDFQTVSQFCRGEFSNLLETDLVESELGKFRPLQCS